MGQGPGAGSGVDLLGLFSGPVHESPVALSWGTEVETGTERLSPASLYWEPLLFALNFALVHLVL